MTINNNGCPGKIRHLNDVATSCRNRGMRVICVYVAESCSCLAASRPCVIPLDRKTRIFQRVLQRERGHCLLQGKSGSGMSVTKQQVTQVFLTKSDVSRIKELYSGDDGERLAEAIRQNCNIWYPRKPLDEWHTACAALPVSLIFPGNR